MEDIRYGQFRAKEDPEYLDKVYAIAGREMKFFDGEEWKELPLQVYRDYYAPLALYEDCERQLTEKAALEIIGEENKPTFESDCRDDARKKKHGWDRRNKGRSKKRNHLRRRSSW
jgi:hypothetical protein